ncbi:MAG TPA: nuclear transport factor 2 family protein [Dehalococcoidia bacterium]|jgi:ketosteroid isomerase-like protein|nr:nuclear transport factor 2 family protein [Dehalococcoidia bacterium]
MIRRGVQRINAGDIGPMLSSFANDAVLVFPGEHSWGGEYHGKAEIEKFLRRFVEVGIQLEPHEILVQGWPWKTTVMLRFTNEARDANGNVVYSNRGAIFAQAVWGKITYQEDYEDTQKVVEFDRYLESRQQTRA